jgi:hypothetical protein
MCIGKGRGKSEGRWGEEKNPANLICMKKEFEERLGQNDKYRMINTEVLRT